MVAVRMLVAVGGASFSWRPKEVVDMSEEDAVKWADGVRAERVETTSSPPPATPEQQPPPATTTQPPPERTTTPAPPAKKARRSVAGGGTRGKRGR